MHSAQHLLADAVLDSLAVQNEQSSLEHYLMEAYQLLVTGVSHCLLKQVLNNRKCCVFTCTILRRLACNKVPKLRFRQNYSLRTIRFTAHQSLHIYYILRVCAKHYCICYNCMLKMRMCGSNLFQLRKTSVNIFVRK